MISSFYKKFSLSNLQNDKPNGQIATVLILVIVVMLILILTTVNLGQLSISATNLSNVVDSSSLYMASQLASRGNQISQSLRKSCGNPVECCQSGGFGGILGAIIGAIIAIVIVVATWGWGAYGAFAVMAGFVGGAVGGAAGSAYSGTPILQGAMQGAMIGAAIGGGAAMGAELGATAGANLAALEVNPALLVAGAPGVTAAELSTYGALSVGYMTTGVGVGAAAGVTLAASSSVYNAYVADQNQAAAFAAASQMLNGLPDYDVVRESVFLQAFSQTVDDPNKDVDNDDLNGNGDITDKVPHFLTWWGARMSYLKGIIPTLQGITSSYFKGTLPTFSDYITQERSEGYDNGSDPVTGAGSLSDEGSIAKVAEALGTGFWSSTGDDSFSAMKSKFDYFTQVVSPFISTDIAQLTSNWQTYIKYFYNEDSGKIVDGKTVTDCYYALEEAKNYISDWKTQIIDKRNQLPSCVYYIEGSGCDLCKLDATSHGGSIDCDIDDEITPALDAIDTLISKTSAFQDATKQYVKDMENTYAALESGYGGLNPATYEWTDSRGDHSIKAYVSPYQLARTETRESGNWIKKEICIRMVDYSGSASIEITRQDPQSKDVKSGKVILGIWNPFFSGTIKKRGNASYSYDTVGMAP